MIDESSPDMDAEFVSDEGRVLTRENIALGVRHEGDDVERVEDGYMVNGTLYRREE